MILGIETSCDDTCAALVTAEGEVRSNVIASQGLLHARYGGVVPEVASRHHLEVLDAVLDDALERAGVGLEAVETVAVTRGPGLVGALLVGVSAAKALAAARGLALTPVDHLHGHVTASLLLPDPVPLPFGVLVASGGHTFVARVDEPGSYATLGRTLDDAAGEAFDKGGRILGLPYPAGPEIDRLARTGDPQRHAFPRSLPGSGLDFSFSGLKTALLYRVRDLGPERAERERADSRRLIPAGDRRRARRPRPWAARARGARAARPGRRGGRQLGGARAHAGRVRRARCGPVGAAARAVHGQRRDDRRGGALGAGAALPGVPDPRRLRAGRRLSPSRRWTVVGLAAVAALVVALPAASGPHGEGGGGSPAPFDGRSPRVPAGERVRMLVGLERPALGEPGGPDPSDPAAQRAHVRSLEREARALISALDARGVKLDHPVFLARVWSGFAATVSTADRPEVEAIAAGAQPVRRFFPATALSVPVDERARGRSPAGPALAQAPAALGPPALALLDSGVDLGHPDLRGRVVAGYDAVRGGERAAGVRAEHGTALAAVLAAALPAEERVLAVRVAGRPAGGEGEEGTTDELLVGLERAIDPDGDGDTEDAVRVALAGVSAPYAGFADAPEAQAARAARRLGTLVVAPAGNDGSAVGPFGTLGSPGAAHAALGIAALPPVAGSGAGLPRVRLALAGRDGRALVEGSLLGGATRGTLDLRTTGLAGPSQAAPRARGRALGGGPLEYFDVEARPRARGRMVVVPAGGRGDAPALAVRAGAAAGAGARALVVCDPGGRTGLRPLPRGAAAGVPVVGLVGRAAREALALTEREGTRARLSAPERRPLAGRAATTSSQGPTYELSPKPDLAANGAAEVMGPGGGRTLVAGTSVSAARAAAAALALHRRAPEASPAELGSRLVGSASSGGPLLERGGGVPDAARAAAATTWADPPLVALRRVGRRVARARLTLRGRGAAAAARSVRAEVEGLAARPPRVRRRRGAVVLDVELAARGTRLPAIAAGRLELSGRGPAGQRAPAAAARAPVGTARAPAAHQGGRAAGGALRRRRRPTRGAGNARGARGAPRARGDRPGRAARARAHAAGRRPQPPAGRVRLRPHPGGAGRPPRRPLPFRGPRPRGGRRTRDNRPLVRLLGAMTTHPARQARRRPAARRSP